MKIARSIASCLALLAIVSCADTHELIRPAGVQSIHLAPADALYVSVPTDGAYGSQIYRGSGQTTAQIIMAALQHRSRSVRSGRAAQSFDEALESARKANSKYLVYSTILHWEDRATEWSSIPDKVEVKIELIDTASGETATSVVVKGKSGIATFGGDHPQDLLPKPIQEFISSLY